MRISEGLSRQMAVMSFVCACLIVGIHSTPSPDVGTWQWWVANLVGKEGICRIAVPWFFLASGFFLAGHFGEDGWWGREVKKRVKSLIFPFFAWTVIDKSIAFIIWGGVKLVGHQCGFKYPFEDGILCSLITMVGVNPFVNVGVVWYLRALFIFVVISPLLYFALKKFGLFLPLILFIGYGVHCTLIYFSNVWDYFMPIRGIAYFSFGAALRMGALNSLLKLRKLLSGVFLCAIGGGGLLLLKLIAWQKGMVMMGNIFDFLMVLPLMLFVWGCCKHIFLPRMCVANSFALYLIHSHLLLFSIVIFVAIGQRDVMNASIWAFALRWLFAAAMSLALAAIIKRYFPKISVLLFGGR